MCKRDSCVLAKLKSRIKILWFYLLALCVSNKPVLLFVFTSFDLPNLIAAWKTMFATSGQFFTQQIESCMQSKNTKDWFDWRWRAPFRHHCFLDRSDQGEIRVRFLLLFRQAAQRKERRGSNLGNARGKDGFFAHKG